MSRRDEDDYDFADERRGPTFLVDDDDETAEPAKPNVWKQLAKRKNKYLMYYQIAAGIVMGARQAYNWYQERSNYYLNVSSDAWEEYEKISIAYRDFKLTIPKSSREFAINERGALTNNKDYVPASWKGLEFEVMHSVDQKVSGGASKYIQSQFNFKFSSREDIEVFSELLKDVSKRDNRPYIMSIDNFFGNNKVYVTRTWESVIVEDDIKAQIRGDIESLHANTERYEDLGLPARRGYVFSGEPGNGKSSMIQAMAHEFGFNITIVDINKFKNNEEFSNNIRNVPAGTIIVFEDIDAFGAVKRDDESEGVNLSGLLNVLDGISTPNNVLFIITTNHIDKLDPAIIRPGRCDRKIEFNNPRHHLIERAYQTFFKEPLDAEVALGHSMATYTEIMRRHVDDSNAARAELKALQPPK